MSFEHILRCHQRVGDLSRSLLGFHAFEELHVAIPDPASPEPAFIRATSWLYCLYFEAGRVSVGFLRGLGETYALLDSEIAARHLEAVRCLRTESHHNLGFADSDQAARTAAEAWRRKACGTAIPRDAEHWTRCYDRLVEEAGSFLGALDEIVRRLEADGDGASMRLEDWRRRLQRSWPAATFDRLIEDAKRRLGREALKTTSFRNRHLDRWRRQLTLLEDGFDFDYEATRLIEKTLLDEDGLLVPITASEVMEALGLKPGPRVGVLLDAARRRFEFAPCTKEELLEHLAKVE